MWHALCKVLPHRVTHRFLIRRPSYPAMETGSRMGDEVDSKENIMDRSAPHLLIAPVPHPPLLDIAVWILAALLASAWLTVWILPAF